MLINDRRVHRLNCIRPASEVDSYLAWANRSNRVLPAVTSDRKMKPYQLMVPGNAILRVPIAGLYQDFATPFWQSRHHQLGSKLDQKFVFI